MNTINKLTDLRQTKEYAKYIELLGWGMKKISGNYVYWKNIPIIGAYIKLQRPNKIIPIYNLMKLIKNERAFNVVIEPLSLKQRDYYLKESFKEFKKPSLPSKTVIINLLNSQKTLLHEMHYKTRYNIKLAKKRNVKVYESDDIDQFSKLWHKSAKRRKMFFSLDKEIKSIYKAFKNKSIILFAEKDAEVISCLLILYTNTTSYYMYAGSLLDGYKNFAPTLLVWEALVRSKNLGLKEFDFEGIYDPRFPLTAWKGFSRFKVSFGGEEVEYPGPLIYRRFPI